MYIALVSVSKDPNLTLAIMESIRAALELQLYRDFGPAWQAAGVDIRLFTTLDAIPFDDEASPLVVFDTPDQSGALGWHAVDPKGRAFGRAFWQILRDHGGTIHNGAFSLSVTLSHEVLETVGDPYISWWADLPNGIQEALEVCDRVQADSYDIDGISVSNFLTPRAFRNGDGPYDFLRLLKTPWEIRPGGYAIRRVGERVENVWGASFPEWQKLLKEEESSRTTRRHENVEGGVSAGS